MTPAIWISLAALACASAQPEARTVEQGFEDVSPLARNTRLDPKDFRRPTDFEKVYEITTPDGKKAYVRVDNGIAAVFSRSEYTNKGDALFPPNMVFHIGATKLLESSSAPKVTPSASPNRIDHSVQRSTQGSAREPAQSRPTPEAEAIPGPPAIVTNEIYRRVRIAQLLQSAAEPA